MPDKTIVVVDDSPTLLKLVQLVLTELGVHIVPVASASAALDAVKAHTPQLVLLDDALEDQPLPELCDGLAKATSPAPPIVLLQSGHGPADPLKVAGVVDSIAKPFTPEALKALVLHVIGRDAAATMPRRRLSLTPPPDFSPEAVTGVPAFAADLAVFGPAELLGLLAEGRKTGRARFTQDRTVIDVHLANGKVAFARAEGVSDEFLLGRFLVEAGALTQDALEAAIGAPPTGSKRQRLGQRLLADGTITDRSLDEAMRMQTAALVYELLRWDAGRGAFSLADALPADEGDLGLAVDNLLLEGCRRIDEWRLIEREVENFDEVFLRQDDRMAAMGPGTLLREEVAVAELLNGKNTVRDVIFQSHLGSFEVCRALYRLRKSKLVRPRVAPTTPP